MAFDIGERLVLPGSRPFMQSARHDGAKYGLATLRALGARLVPEALCGEIGRTSVNALSERYECKPELVRAFFQQPDTTTRLNLVGECVVAGQARELALELARHPEPRIVWVRTQPTCPLEGVHASYRGKYVFGIAEGRPSGTFDSMYATFSSLAEGGREQSISVGGLVKGLEKDREAWQGGDAMEYLSPLQRLSLTQPAAAMFLHAGAVDAAARPEIPEGVDASQIIFLQGRFEGYEPGEWLASPSATNSIVSEPGYQRLARRALGDDMDIVVEAEGSNPIDQGLECRHVYADPDGHVFDNETVRDILDRGQPYRLDRNWIEAEHRGLGLLLLGGELRARAPGGRDDAGQALLRMTENDELRLFTILNRSDGRRAWTGTEADKREKLKRLAEAFAMLEAGDSTAGHTRRQQFEALQIFDVPMSNPSGRENVWRVASAARQAQLPEAPLGAVLLQ
jgi:hypothetical protein